MQHPVTPIQETYKDRQIDIKPKGAGAELRINNVRMQFLQDPLGLFRLRRYAYDPAPSLLEAAKRFVDYQARQHRPVRKGKK